MKRWHIVLLLSVGLNIVLAIAYIEMARPKPALTARTEKAPLVAPALSSAGWQSVFAENLATERDRLAAEGFPPNLIRALLAARIHSKYAERRGAIENALAQLPFWKEARDERQLNAQLTELGREEQRELRKLVGPEAGTGAARYARTFPELPAEKYRAVADADNKYNEAIRALNNGVGHSWTADDYAQRRAAENERQTALAQTLTPAELDLYNMRFSATANRMRQNLVSFAPTEAEFREIYSLQSTFDQNYPTQPGMSQAQMKGYSEAQTALNDTLAASLGADRYAQYQRAQDYNYRQSTQLVARLELPPETADTLYALQQEYQKKQSTLYQTPSPGENLQDVVNSRKAEMQAEAMARVTQALGGNADAAQAYIQYGGGWLGRLAPQKPGVAAK